MSAQVRMSLLDELGIDRACTGNLSSFIDLFEKWNRSINLSAASTRNELIEHVEDSLHVVPHLRASRRVLDVGSGGGFPVVVAAICLPETDFVALEPVHKKHAFLKTAARELELGNLTARAERLEDHDGRDYDVAMSRATFDLKEWLAMAVPFVVKGGLVIGFEAIPRTDLGEVQRCSYALNGKQRSLVLLRT
jgi:16S rRNA (guanine527-N7)-methyltransferase